MALGQAAIRTYVVSRLGLDTRKIYRQAWPLRRAPVVVVAAAAPASGAVESMHTANDDYHDVRAPPASSNSNFSLHKESKLACATSQHSRNLCIFSTTTQIETDRTQNKQLQKG